MPIEQNGAMLNADALARALRAAGSTAQVAIDGSMDNADSLTRALVGLGGKVGIERQGAMLNADAVQRLLASGLGAAITTPALRAASASNYYPYQPAQYNLGTGATTVDIYQVDPHVIAADVTALVIAVPMQLLWPTLGVRPNGNSLNVQQCYLNYNGVTVPVTFGGLTSVIAPDITTLLSDPIPIASFGATKFGKGTTAQIRWHFQTTAPTTDKFPCSQVGFGTSQSIYLDPLKATVTNGPSGIGPITYSMINGGVNGTDAKFGNRVSAILLGVHSSPSVAIPGDSKTFGTGDTPTTIGAQGVSRVLFADATNAATVVWPGINFGSPGGIAADCFTSNAGGVVATFEAFYAYCTHAIVGYGTNALNSANQTTLYGRLRAKGINKIVQRSLTPNATSSDSFTTTAGQTTAVGWSVGGAADTYEATLRGFVASDANLAYYQSTGERTSPTPGTSAYWQWIVNGTAFFATADGKHETATAYELNLGSAGSITTQAGGTIAQSLRAWVAALT